MDSASDRYARQVQYGPIGAEGQSKIRNATVAVLGCGALGTVAAELLARAGVGHLRVIDRDVVEWSNLQRQSLFGEQDASEGRSKADAACQQLAAINSGIELTPIVTDVNSGNMEAILNGCDLIIDAADNFLIRFLLNDWSLRSQTPWVHGGCIGATGQVRLFDGEGSPCFRCLVPAPPPAAAVDTCDTAGVIGAATHLIASLQAIEAIKWLSGNRSAVDRNLKSVDLWNNRVRSLTLASGISQACPACKEKRFDFLEGDRAVHSESAAALCGRDAVQISRPHEHNVDLALYVQRWNTVGRVQSTPFFVRLFPDAEHSVTLFRDGRVVITGTSEITEARTLCDRFVGG